MNRLPATFGQNEDGRDLDALRRALARPESVLVSTPTHAPDAGGVVPPVVVLLCRRSGPTMVPVEVVCRPPDEDGDGAAGAL